MRKLLEMILCLTMLIAIAVIMTGCTEEDFTNTFQSKERSKNDIMLIKGQSYDVSNKLYTKLFDCIKGLNEDNKEVDKDLLADKILRAKEFGTYIHLERTDGKNLTYISYKGYKLLWGDIPARTDATGKLTKKRSSYYSVSPQAAEQIRKAEKDAYAHPKTEKIIPK